MIEHYEACFVHVESCLDAVKCMVNKSGNVLTKPLRYNGINIDEDETNKRLFNLLST